MKAAGKPYRTGRGKEEYYKGYEGGGGGVKIGTGKGGGGNTTVFMLATVYGTSTKKRFGQTRENTCQCKKSRSSLLILDDLDNRK